MSDFEAEVRNSLRAIQSQVTALDLSVKKINTSAAGMGRQVATAFGSGAAAAEVARRAAERYNLTLKHGAMIAQSTGGFAGGIAGRFASGIGVGGGGMGATFALTAVAGLLVRTLVKGVIENLQVAMSRVERVEGKERRASRIVAEAERTKGQQGIAVLGDVQTQQALFALGGQQALNDVEAHRKARPHLSRKEISEAILKSFDEPDDEKRGNLRYAAARISDTGLFTMPQAMDALMSNRGLRSKIEGGDRKQIAWLLNEMRGLPMTPKNIEESQAIMGRSYGRDVDPFTKKGKEAMATLNQVHEVGRERVISGDATAAAAEMLAIAINPLAASMKEFIEELRSRESVLLRQAELQEKALHGIIAFIQDRSPGEGSLRRQADQERTENSQITGRAFGNE